MSVVLTAHDGGIARITMNRPEKLNAIDAELARGLRAAFERAAEDDAVRAIVFSGNGRAFCAGQDLGDPEIAPGSDLGATIEANYNPLVRAMRALPKPIVAKVQGIAAGAGANLAFAADIVIASRSAAFAESFSRIGLLPDSGGTWMLPRLVGHARASALALLGEKFSAEQAEAWGAIWKVVEESQLDKACDELTHRLAEAPTMALGAVKQALQQHWARSFDAALDGERDLQRMLGDTSDYREGVAAFTSKRSPRFIGK
jgi:2-(1,2-epoxy-1,2-dihydrophenyl)acetyl-CoA isomerase